MEGPIMIIYDPKWQGAAPLQVKSKEPKLVQLDKVMCKQFTATSSKGNPW